MVLDGWGGGDLEVKYKYMYGLKNDESIIWIEIVLWTGAGKNDILGFNETCLADVT